MKMEPSEYKLLQEMNYQINEEVMEMLSIGCLGKDGSDTRPRICLNCFYSGFYGGCSFNKDNEGRSIDLVVDRLGYCDKYVASPYT